jgi:hypothetical protein
MLLRLPCSLLRVLELDADFQIKVHACWDDAYKYEFEV